MHLRRVGDDVNAGGLVKHGDQVLSAAVQKDDRLYSRGGEFALVGDEFIDLTTGDGAAGETMELDQYFLASQPGQVNVAAADGFDSEIRTTLVLVQHRAFSRAFYSNAEMFDCFDYSNQQLA